MLFKLLLFKVQLYFYSKESDESQTLPWVQEATHTHTHTCSVWSYFYEDKKEATNYSDGSKHKDYCS